MKFNPQKLGAGLLATSPLMLHLSGNATVWWIGVGFACIAPFFMAIESHGN